MDSPEIRQAVLEHFARGVEAARKRFDPTTGRFLADNGGWAVTNQDLIFPLAVLHATEGTAWHGSDEVLALAERGGDALRDWQDDRGRFEFIKTDGSRWGMTYMCWSMYHWVEAYGLLRAVMDPDRRRRWEEGLRLSFHGVAKELRERPRLHNIPCWHAMGMVQASQLLDEPALLEAGTQLIRRHVESQTPDGYWAEGGGPTTSYNLIYLHAIGLYHAFTGDESVLGCLRRGLDFHLHFTYPDGAGVETVDGRVRYRSGCIRAGYPAFFPFADGRRLVGHLVEQLQQQEPRGGLRAQLAPVPLRLPDGPQEPIPQERRQFVSVHHGRALVRRSGPWFHCLSGYLTPTRFVAERTRSRWIKDRQSYLSVWHERLGLVVGGGNSKHQPEFSTFEVICGRVKRLQADEAVIETGDDGDTLKLTYGDVRCEVSVSAGEAEAIELTFGAEAGASDDVQIIAGFTLPHLDGATLRASAECGPYELDALTERGVGWPAEAAEKWLEIGRLRIELTGGGRFEWPVYPVNPYAIDNAAPSEQAVGLLTHRLDPGGEPWRVRLIALDAPASEDDR
jgi:hypothetical protein